MVLDGPAFGFEQQVVGQVQAIVEEELLFNFEVSDTFFRETRGADTTLEEKEEGEERSEVGNQKK